MQEWQRFESEHAAAVSPAAVAAYEKVGEISSECFISNGVFLRSGVYRVGRFPSI